MKKFALLVIAMAAMTVQNVMAQDARIMLRHNGNVTLYSPSNLQTAIDACEEGDTISLSKGLFHDGNDLSIKKSITIIGNGNGESIINAGKIQIGQSYSETLVLNNRLLDGVRVTGRIELRCADKLKIRKCIINGDIAYYDFDGYTQVDIENCYCQSVGSLHSVKAVNSIINDRIYYANDCLYLNCQINSYLEYFNGVAENCIIMDQWYGLNTGTYKNTLFGGSEDTVNEYVRTNCYFTGKKLEDEEITPEALAENGYLGTDGTIVGPYGGLLPYSLEKKSPISSVNVEPDYVNQKLNVTIKKNEN